MFIFLFASRRRHTRCALVTEFRRVLFRSLCFRPPGLAPREGSVAARQHSWAAWRRGRAARCDAANAALREVGAAYPRQAEAVRGISRLWTNLANRLARRGGKRPKQCDMCSARSEEHTSELQSLMRISYAVFCLKKKNKMKNKYVRI